MLYSKQCYKEQCFKRFVWYVIFITVLIFQMTKFSATSRRPSTTQAVAKKHLKAHLKRIRNREYCRLRDMVPAIANKQKVSKVRIVNFVYRKVQLYVSGYEYQELYRLFSTVQKWSYRSRLVCPRVSLF